MVESGRQDKTVSEQSIKDRRMLNFFLHTLHTLTLERPRKVGAIDGQPADKLGSTVMSSGWQHITHDWNGGTLISDE